jgi:16S rRNA processing protein RimM
MPLPGLELTKLPADAVEVGRIADAWGVQGWFKVHPYSTSPGGLIAAKQWFLASAEPSARRAEGVASKLLIQEVKPHCDAWVARAQQITDRTGAEALRGARVFVPRADFPATAQDEYYWVDLIGLQVINRAHVSLGVIQELLSTSAQTVLVVGFTENGKQRERMIPFVSVYVDKVDLAERCVWVDWQPDF